MFNEDPFGSPPYLTLNDAKKLPESQWLVHFTDASVFKAFDRGATLEGLHLSTWRRAKTFVQCPKNLDWESLGIYDVVFGFAYRAEEFTGQRGMAKLAARQKIYGDTTLLFQSDCAVEAYHSGDEEWQAVFPLCSERNLVPFSCDTYTGFVTVEGDDGEDIEVGSIERLIERIEYEQERRPKKSRGKIS